MADEYLNFQRTKKHTPDVACHVPCPVCKLWSDMSKWTDVLGAFKTAVRQLDEDKQALAVENAMLRAENAKLRTAIAANRRFPC